MKFFSFKKYIYYYFFEGTKSKYYLESTENYMNTKKILYDSMAFSYPDHTIFHEGSSSAAA